VLVIPLLWLVLVAAGMFRPKIKRGIQARKKLFSTLLEQERTLPRGPRVWFHSSSMGEFEQAKPIISALKEHHPSVVVIVSFFSPSGYEHSRSYQHADIITYIPFDTRSKASRFLDIIRPDAAIMVRYDIWPNHIWELHRREIPILIGNATMRRQTPRRLPLAASFHHHVYGAMSEILTVTEDDAQSFDVFNLNGPFVHAVGDTRYDQVYMRSLDAQQRHVISPHILQNKRIIVAGSSWQEDEDVLLPAFLSLSAELDDLLLILVPHEPTVEHLDDLESSLHSTISTIRFSSLHEYRGEKIILIDSIGILLSLYAYADLAYVGGSFRQGVHNVLEPAVFGIPVLFGPRYRNSPEPLALVDRGGAFVVNDTNSLYRTMKNLLCESTARISAGEKAERFVHSNRGATSRFLNRLQPYLIEKRPVDI
jgi:3-deoxy-D-manno-octulosonic-acid transferase